MDCAIITGADNPIGQAIARRIIDMGYRVYGLGQFRRGSAFEHRQFHPIGCDLTQPMKITESLETIAEDKRIVSLLIHASPVSSLPGKDGAGLDDLEPGEVEALMRMQLLGPILLSRLLLKPLTRAHGHLLFLSPAVDPSGPANPALLAATSGLRRFAHSLFERERKHGLRVTNLILDPNDSARQSLRSGEAQELLNPKQVALAAEQILRTAAEGNVVTELVLRPQIPEGGDPLPKTGSPVDPYREILLPPSENFPSEPAPIVIPKRPQSRQTISPEDIEKAEKTDPDPDAQKKSRRRNRRRNRGRRNRGSDAPPTDPRHESGQTPGPSGERGEPQPKAIGQQSAAENPIPAGNEKPPERSPGKTDPAVQGKRDDPSGKTGEETSKPKKAAPKAKKSPPKKTASKKKSAAKKKTAPKKKAPPKKKSGPKKKAAAKKKAAKKKD